MNDAVYQYSMRPAASASRRRLRVALFVGLIGLLAIPVFAQVPADSASDDAKNAVTVESVEADLAAIEENPGLEDAVKDLLRPKYQEAIDLLRKAEEFDAQAAAYRRAMDEAPGMTEQFRDELQQLPSVDQAKSVTPPKETDALEQEIESRKAAFEQLNQELTKVRSELTRIKARPLEIGDQLTEVQRELSEVETQLASPEFSADVTSPGRIADRVLLQARHVKLQNELEMLRQEEASQSVRETMLQAQQDLLVRQVENAAAALGKLDGLLQERLTSEAQRIRSLADEIPENLPKGDSAVQSLAQQVQSWATEFEEVVTGLQAISAAEDRVASRLDRLSREYEDIQHQISLGTGGRAMTQYLLDLRRTLPDSGAFSANQSPTLLSIDEARLTALEVENALREQQDVERQFIDHPSGAVEQLVQVRRELLEKLRTQYRQLIRAQASLQATQQQYMELVAEVRAFIGEQLFWMQSSPALNLTAFTEVPAGLRWIFRSEHRVELGQAFQQALRRAPTRSIGIAVAIAVLLIMRGRIVAALEQMETKVCRISTDRYSHTYEAILWTLLLAVPIPLLIGGTAWALHQAFNPSDWLRGVRYGLQVAAWLALGFGFFAEVCRPGGLGAVHFGWKKSALPRLRRATLLMASVYIPAIVLTISCALGDAANYFDSVGRLSLVVAHFWLALVLWYLFQSSHGVFATLKRDYRRRRITRWRYIWFPLLVAAPLGLALLAIAGYVIAAYQLSRELLVTAGLVAGGNLLYYLILRWFKIKQRRLALAEALEKRRARQQAAASEQQHSQSSEAVAIEPEAEEQLNLESVSEQTRHVIRLLVGLLVAIGIVVLWSGTIPMMQFLETIPVPILTGVNLLELGQALLVAVSTAVVVLNLPGLLELAALRATTMKPGTRIAVSTLAQYAVVAIGGFWALSLLDVDWAAFAWIAAALSVGLGFGLQEVVANFVCGLILLFERPIRVGDVVTVEGMTGTVTRVHMRATTIINWDRQEFVVPNKNLITNTILNWTLSATTNRVTIAVGVAYGSDTTKARQILLDIASEHPLLLDDPAPIATFEEFADSTLTLRLRAYIPDMDNRLQTITELHTEIDKRFAAADIEIAFPQRDLHLRSGWKGADRAGMETFADTE